MPNGFSLWDSETDLQEWMCGNAIEVQATEWTEGKPAPPSSLERDDNDDKIIVIGNEVS